MLATQADQSHTDCMIIYLCVEPFAAGLIFAKHMLLYGWTSSTSGIQMLQKKHYIQDLPHIYHRPLAGERGLLHCLDMCKCTAALVDGRNEAFVDGRNTAPHLREPMPGSPVAAVFTAAGALLTRVIQVQLGSQLGQCKLSGVHPAFCPALPFPMDQPDTIKKGSATSNLPLGDIHHQLV